MLYQGFRSFHSRYPFRLRHKDSAHFIRAILSACGGRYIQAAASASPTLFFASKGFESELSALRRKNQALRARLLVVEIEGFEPSLTEPESVVLPLHHISILYWG